MKSLFNEMKIIWGLLFTEVVISSFIYIALRIMGLGHMVSLNWSSLVMLICVIVGFVTVLRPYVLGKYHKQ